jgi:RNA polymerase sigma factor (sigma-70 family)
LIRENDLLALIEKEIAALPEKMRVVFELSRKESMNRKEISEHLGLPENTVKTNMYRALKMLYRKLCLF